MVGPYGLEPGIVVVRASLGMSMERRTAGVVEEVEMGIPPRRQVGEALVAARTLRFLLLVV